MLALDANILLRGVLGRKVKGLIEAYADIASFVAADAAVEEARRYLPGILHKRQLAVEPAMATLEKLLKRIDVVEISLYVQEEDNAKSRLRSRDIEDWPTAALALALGCPIWTEDADFFGTGIATWTTDRVEIYLKSLIRPS